MSDRAALLAAIIANPDEDTPRLVYADWLDEHGSPDPAGRAGSTPGAGSGTTAKRAAHIRAQIAFHQLAASDTAPAAVERFLSGQYGDGFDRIDWSAVDAEVGSRIAAREAHVKRPFKLRAAAEGLPRVRGVAYRNYERGFFDEVLIDDVESFLDHADAIFRSAPITGATFEELTGEGATDFIAAGHLTRLRTVTFSFDVEPDAIRAFGAHKDASGVRRLDVESDFGAEDVVEALTAGKHWSGLESLYLSDLDQAGESLPEDGQMARLFARPQFRKLRTLTAWGSCIDDDALMSIVRHLHELRELDVSQNPIMDGELAFATARNLRNLRTLDLSSCDLDGGDPALLISAANLPNLTVLRLDDCNLRAPDPKTLAKRGRGPGLRVLALDGAHLSEESVEAMVRCPALRDLWYLALEHAELGDDHLERFTKHAAFEHLAYLDLSINNLTARGMRALAAWPGAARLQWLDVANNAIGQSGAKALAASPHLAGLKYLRADGRGVAVLKKRFKKAFA